MAAHDVVTTAASTVRAPADTDSVSGAVTSTADDTAATSAVVTAALAVAGIVTPIFRNAHLPYFSVRWL